MSTRAGRASTTATGTTTSVPARFRSSAARRPGECNNPPLERLPVLSIREDSDAHFFCCRPVGGGFGRTGHGETTGTQRRCQGQGGRGGREGGMDRQGRLVPIVQVDGSGCRRVSQDADGGRQGGTGCGGCPVCRPG